MPNKREFCEEHGKYVSSPVFRNHNGRRLCNAREAGGRYEDGGEAGGQYEDGGENEGGEDVAYDPEGSDVDVAPEVDLDDGV
uniref:Uncharacterized protein n=1 Tax=Panagrolaimus superbus TaxID=310955 RepID=A0A914Z939_9BILA